MLDEKLIEAGVKVLGLSVVAKTLEGPVQTLNDIWGLCGGDRLHQYRLEKIKVYANEIAKNISTIPKDKIQSPPLSVIGPALEASKFYIEEEEIRNMFSNLIAASMNSDCNDKVHHSFIETIKQLSPYDAKFFQYLEEDSPLIELRHQIGKDNERNSFGTDLFPIFFVSKTFENHSKNAIALLNLQKNGLIEIIHDRYLNDIHYKPYYNNLHYLSYKKFFENNPVKLTQSNGVIVTTTLRINKKFIKITDLGRAFKDICCEKI